MAARPLRLVHPRSGRVLVERLRVPRTFVGRGMGLMLRRSLPPGDGMWIAPCNGIHMFLMRFPIDAVFLDRRLRVIRVYPGLRPWRVVPLVWRAHGVLELPAGTVADLGLERGEPLEIA
ncbi:MAG TPA: DUF192 domain-containing protein [Candidatus Dormibacteraeota bacterium]|nr:DUF192 domain-containing protein [Candidatus Dormibacteraeota bacterium]